MARVAILIGNSKYQNLSTLDCCLSDLAAIKELLAATENYDEITTIENADADELKQQLRAAINKVNAPEELFYYFSGHGLQRENEFFHCACNFDPNRPNETGLSTTELHTLLRLTNSEFVVKVIDACNSGTPLIKAETQWAQQNKAGFRNLIQIASCLESQSSFTGNPLSQFTAKFRDAALRKVEGPVFYTDIINTLRDDFIDNSSQTPFFVSQQTGREQFVDDAKRLDALRKSLKERTTSNVHSLERPATLVERLRAADAMVVTADVMVNFVGDFLDSLIKEVSTSEFSEFFNVENVEHTGFEEPTARNFIIACLSKERRADNFVTAEYTRKMRAPNALLTGTALSGYLGDDMFDESWTLHLNCTMTRAQLKITFTPKFMNLQRIVLVVTCAPSLDHCYVFEIATQHMLCDFGKFDANGPEIAKRWWKLSWRKDSSGVAAQIAQKLDETVRAQLEAAEKRLSKDLPTASRSAA